MSEKTKLIRDYTVTSADKHDVKGLNTVLPKDTRSFMADSGYTGVMVTRKGKEEEPSARPVNKYIVKRRVRGQKELSEQTKQLNKRMSRIRCRVEQCVCRAPTHGRRLYPGNWDGQEQCGGGKKL